MGSLTHLDETGRPTMVDVGGKPETARMAEAVGELITAPETLDLLERGETPKGDPLVVAQLAGIQAAKRTAELIPLCHPLPLTRVAAEFELLPGAEGEVRLQVTAETVGPTGVEMEALTAVQVGLLTVYDMCKAVDRAMVIDGVRLLEKHGGKSGSFVADRQAADAGG